eukprot:CAMPEP_0119425936 /NCGR_PEP_ID=MMETSP1335-20130426/35350_1 /TAXON_ID=259385 /ORGANISM="Chrysoculter rhomboideus, Strain RCC1486" /LENGTH=430 /DNA_ID=CAMNT_0007451515 /DNA_START=43 /DNA_END=1332 /DNA_ORIENTATION=-
MASLALLALAGSVSGAAPAASRGCHASAFVRGGMVRAPHGAGAATSPLMLSSGTPARAGNVLVLDMTDNYYASRDIFQQLYSFGNWAKIACVTSSTTQAKKMLLSREARYSGLIDVIEIIEAPDVAAPGGDAGEQLAQYDTWLLLNADESKLAAHVSAAKASGVRRLLVTISTGASGGALPDAAGLERMLTESGMAYTVIRTGELSKDVLGSPLRIDAIDTPVCAELSRADAFRVAMEALTIEDAHGKMFSLCPADSDDVSAVFKEMRFAGADRRQEVVALIRGAVEQRSSQLKEEQEKAAAKKVAAAAGAPSADVDPAEAAAKSKVDVEAAFQRAQERAKRVAEEEAQRAALLDEKRKERAKTQNAIDAKIAERAAASGGGDKEGAGPKPSDEGDDGEDAPGGDDSSGGDGDGGSDGGDGSGGGGSGGS